MPYFYQYVHSTFPTIKVKFRVPTWWYPNILPIDAYIPFGKKKWQSYTNNITNIPFRLLSSVCTLSWTVAEKETKYATAYSIKFSTELFVLIVPTSVNACCVWGRAELCSWCTLTLAIIIVKKSFKPLVGFQIEILPFRYFTNLLNLQVSQRILLVCLQSQTCPEINECRFYIPHKRGLFHWHGVTSKPAGISNYIHFKAWVKLIHFQTSTVPPLKFVNG